MYFDGTNLFASFGEGPVDLVVLPGPYVPIDSIDAEPSMYRFHRRLASSARVIRFEGRQRVSNSGV